MFQRFEGLEVVDEPVWLVEIELGIEAEVVRLDSKWLARLTVLEAPGLPGPSNTEILVVKRRMRSHGVMMDANSSCVKTFPGADLGAAGSLTRLTARSR